MPSRDPLTGWLLPSGITARRGFPPVYTVRDSYGRFIGGNNRNLIIQGWRESHEGYQGTRTGGYDAAVLYHIWHFRRTGTSDYPGTRRDSDMTDGEKNLTDGQRRQDGRSFSWIHDQSLTLDPSRLDRLRQILTFEPPAGGGAGLAVEDICTLGCYPVRPYRLTDRIPKHAYLVEPSGISEGVGKDLRRSIEKKAPWLVGEGVTMVYGSHTLRKVANLQTWRDLDQTLPPGSLDCANEILRCARALHLPPGPTPAGMAWRYFRSFQRGPWPWLPPEAIMMAENATAEYVILGPNVKGEAESYIYDLNNAYANWLQEWPDLSTGRWARCSHWQGPFAVYRHRTGYVGGQALLEGWDEEPYATWRQEIRDGWYWSGEHRPSPIRSFVRATLDYDGPCRSLVRRFSPLVVGKSRSAGKVDGVLYGGSAFYPVVWANVVGALQVRMLAILRRVRWIAAYIDAIHVQDPLPTDWLGTRPGLWKLIDSGMTTYHGIGNWQSPHELRHQGSKFTPLWATVQNGQGA